MKTSITVRVARSASCLSVHCQSVCLLSVCLSSRLCLLVCPSAIIVCLSALHCPSHRICLISVCDEGAVVRLAARRGTQHPLLGGEVHVSQWTQHPLMGGEVLVAPRVGRAAVYAEAVCSPTTVLCPSALSLYCALSICLPACLLVSRAGGSG